MLQVPTWAYLFTLSLMFCAFAPGCRWRSLSCSGCEMQPVATSSKKELLGKLEKPIGRTMLGGTPPTFSFSMSRLKDAAFNAFSVYSWKKTPA